MSRGVVLREVEERVMLQESVLKVIALDGIDLHVGHDTAAAVNGAAAVSQLYFFIYGVVFLVALEVVIVKRNIAIVALNETSAWGVIFGGRQRQAGVVRQWIHSLHQSLAKRGFADD